MNELRHWASENNLRIQTDIPTESVVVIPSPGATAPRMFIITPPTSPLENQGRIFGDVENARTMTHRHAICISK